MGADSQKVVICKKKVVLEQQLFLWSVLMRRKDLAMCFWEAGNVSGDSNTTFVNCCHFFCDL